MRLKTASAPDLGARDALVMGHVDLVRALAGRLHRRVPSHVELSELVSVGVMGLIDAANRYQAATGVPFDAFARRRIHGAMLDALRGLDSVPRSVRRLQRALEEALARLRHSLGREPEAAEIARDLGLSSKQYEDLLGDLRTVEVAVVKRVNEDGGDGESLLEMAIDPDLGPYAEVERRELRARLAQALRDLPERERQILAMYYQEELTLAEIGQVIGVGESRVSQLRSQAILRLRSRLAEWLPVKAKAS